MTIRSLRIAATLLCTLPLIWTACGGSDTPEDTKPAPSAAATPSAAEPTPAAAPAAPAAEAPAATATATAEFAETKWTLLEIEPNGGDAITTEAAAVPMLQFSGKASPDGVTRMTGFGGCNQFIGDYTAGDDGSLSIGDPLGMTMTACPDPIQNVESALMKILGGVSSYSLDGGELTIQGKNGSARFGGG